MQENEAKPNKIDDCQMIFRTQLKYLTTMYEDVVVDGYIVNGKLKRHTILYNLQLYTLILVVVSTDQPCVPFDMSNKHRIQYLMYE